MGFDSSTVPTPKLEDPVLLKLYARDFNHSFVVGPCRVRGSLYTRLFSFWFSVRGSDAGLFKRVVLFALLSYLLWSSAAWAGVSKCYGSQKPRLEALAPNLEHYVG